MEKVAICAHETGTVGLCLTNAWRSCWLRNGKPIVCQTPVSKPNMSVSHNRFWLGGRFGHVERVPQESNVLKALITDINPMWHQQRQILLAFELVWNRNFYRMGSPIYFGNNLFKTWSLSTTSHFRMNWRFSERYKAIKSLAFWKLYQESKANLSIWRDFLYMFTQYRMNIIVSIHCIHIRETCIHAYI